ncbi:MAG: transposase [Pseudomonadales bacterium]|nr:transposase [Pseudomonadales bacterium]
MPRANRYFYLLPGHVWHITHRCHKQEFLLKFARDRARWLHWLFEAKRRYGLCVLNYVVTSNHIHLLVKDDGASSISRSLQLIAGRTGQEYNQRKARNGAFWEDRYHATAVATDEHFFQCLVYIDLNMVRAGVVGHPAQWPYGGYREIQRPPERYRIIDIAGLLDLAGVRDLATFQAQHRHWVQDALKRKQSKRDRRWTDSIAVGSASYIEKVKTSLGIAASHKPTIEQDSRYFIKEDEGSYRGRFDGKKAHLRPKDGTIWHG